MRCTHCGLRRPPEHRFCVDCGTPLPGDLVPPQSPKVSRWFWSVPVVPQDNPNLALRASRYLDQFEIRAGDESVLVPRHHVRISIWEEDHAVGAMSLPDHEAHALARFLLSTVSSPEALAGGVSG